MFKIKGLRRDYRQRDCDIQMKGEFFLNDVGKLEVLQKMWPPWCGVETGLSCSQNLLLSQGHGTQFWRQCPVEVH